MDRIRLDDQAVKLLSLVKPEIQTHWPCNHCQVLVNVYERNSDFRNWSEEARWGIEQALNTFGTLCDSCYDRQESVR